MYLSSIYYSIYQSVSVYLSTILYIYHLPIYMFVYISFLLSTIYHLSIYIIGTSIDWSVAYHLPIDLSGNYQSNNCDLSVIYLSTNLSVYHLNFSLVGRSPIFSQTKNVPHWNESTFLQKNRCNWYKTCHWQSKFNIPEPLGQRTSPSRQICET